MEPITNEFNQTVKPSSPLREAWLRLRRNRMAVLGLVVVALYFLLALLAPVLPFYPYERQAIDHQNLPPSLEPAGKVMMATRTAYLELLKQAEKRTDYTQAERETIDRLAAAVKTDAVHGQVYLGGTDQLGRDMLSRTVHGGRVSILVGLVGTVAALLIGIVIGAIAGYAGGKVDAVLMRIVDIIYGLPYMLLVIIMMALFGRSMLNLFVAIALVSWLDVARVVRGQIMSLKNAEFVEAARSMGAGHRRVVFRHLVPNTAGVLIVYATLVIPKCIISESFLSFLGLGVSAPLASWGSLISEGVKTMEMYPWQLLVPAATMTIFLFAINFLGDGLRDAFDPKSRNH